MQTLEVNLDGDADVIAIGPKVHEATTAARVEIKTPAQFKSAGEWLKTVKGLLKKIEDARTRITKPINESLREVNNQARQQSQPLLDAELAIKRSMGAYTSELERLRREEQRRADEAARREQEKLQAQAAKAVASGKMEKAEHLEHRAASVVAPVIQREAPKVSGITTREFWKFEVTDPSVVPREYMSVDETKIRKVVQALKGDARIAGVRVYPDTQIAAGAN